MANCWCFILEMRSLVLVLKYNNMIQTSLVHENLSKFTSLNKIQVFGN